MFPGCAFAFGTAETCETGAVGRFRYDRDAPVVTDATPFDLASLTKVVCTTPLCHWMWTNRGLEFDWPVRSILPQFQHPGVTVEHLLRHQSGLMPYLSEPELCQCHSDVVDQICRLELTDAPGSRTVYSCLGFILLQEILERLTEDPLDRLYAQHVAQPLGAHGLSFRGTSDLDASSPPTMVLEPWRHDKLGNPELGHGFVQGVVHDPLAFVSGGVSGNAGLFGSAQAVAAFAQSVVRHLSDWNDWMPVAGLGRRGLGWDVRDPSASSAGPAFPPGSFGHTGFTGTSIWIDPVAGFFAVLLTNSIHPDGPVEAIRESRARYNTVAHECVCGKCT